MPLDINKLIQPTDAYNPELTDPILQPYKYISEVPSNNQNVRTRFYLHSMNCSTKSKMRSYFIKSVI